MLEACATAWRRHPACGFTKLPSFVLPTLPQTVPLTSAVIFVYEKAALSLACDDVHCRVYPRALAARRRRVGKKGRSAADGARRSGTGRLAGQLARAHGVLSGLLSVL